MIGLTCLQIYISVFLITEERSFELHRDAFDELSFTKFKDEV